MKNVQLTPFCRNLTGISQEVIDSADTFVVVFKEFEQWMDDNKVSMDNDNVAFCTDGPYDVTRFLFDQFQDSKMMFPSYLKEWVDVRITFKLVYWNQNNTLSPTLARMLLEFKWEFEGSPHSGMDDTTNIARIVSKLIKDGVSVSCNRKLDKKRLAILQKEGGNQYK